ncbi:acyl-CoA reductase [Pseudomonas izuensis]|uniref:acyl-CoA reductase n=1 Tax=Pseudomonas izuensis TaxID=2684212 RepID=UPI00135B1BAE|nr:acyl-CoA reductase [Pseudomonas izuensis]
MPTPIAPMIIRGEIITDQLIEIGGRGGDLRFHTPDANCYLDRLPLSDPARLADLYQLHFADILDYTDELAGQLDFSRNHHLQEACELSYATAPTTPPLVKAQYMSLARMLDRQSIHEAAEQAIGIDHLEGWVRKTLHDGRDVEIRCFGARTLHIVAGNSPGLSLLSIVRNMILRSDALIKAPSNDPFTATAIARTMIDMAPDHPLTRHLSVAYWRGGDQALEAKLYRPQHFEKIVAWGGFASIKHVSQYIQPGLELISLDPKRSVSILGAETFGSPERMREAALRLACDIGAHNQQGCVNARVVYAVSGTDESGLDQLNLFGEYVYDALLTLPNSISTRPKRYDPELAAHLRALRLEDEWYRVIGGEDGEGAVIVSQLPDPVSFAAALNDRTANLVPVNSLDEVMSVVDASTQTVGIYPENLKDELKDRLPLHGAQRIVSLGYAIALNWALPQDSIEPLRRMGKWIVNEICTPARIPGPWQRPNFEPKTE